MAIDNGKEPELGAATPNGLAATAAAKMGTYSNPSLPAHRRFFATAIQTVRRRRVQSDGKTDQNRIAVFLLCDRVRAIATTHHGALEPLFKDGTSELTGRVWFTTVEMNTGYRRDLPEIDNGVVFAFIESELGLGTIPAVVFDPRPSTPVFRLYPRGIAHGDECERYELNDFEVTRETLIETLDRFYEKYLKTPVSTPLGGKVWQNSDNWIPVPKTEEKIQATLTSNLLGAFRECDIRAEEPTDEGRADIFIVQHSNVAGVGWVYLAALELKVLRSFWSTEKKVVKTLVPRELKKGLKQAVAYRTARKAQTAVLCCYDMRSEDTGEACFEPIRAPAKKYDVALKRWYLYKSPEAYREATYPT